MERKFWFEEVYLKRIYVGKGKSEGGKHMGELRKQIHDNNNGLDYVLVGDYYLPVLSLPEETRPIGYWGMLRKEYLKEHKSGMYSCLLLTAGLDSHLADVNEQAQKRFELFEEQVRIYENDKRN